MSVLSEAASTASNTFILFPHYFSIEESLAYEDAYLATARADRSIWLRIGAITGHVMLAQHRPPYPRQVRHQYAQR